MFIDKIKAQLKTEYKSFGLSNEAIDRIASAREKTVTEESQVETAVQDADTMKLIAVELQKMRDSEIQKRTDLQREHDDYKAKHPEKKEGEGKGEGEGGQQTVAQPDIAKMVTDAVAAAVTPLKEALDAYKSQSSAKEAKTLARESFFGNKWTTKFQDEANDSWERANELNDAQGGKMTADELCSKALGYFNKSLSRKGVDATKPFESESATQTKLDFSDQVKILEKEGVLKPEEK